MVIVDDSHRESTEPDLASKRIDATYEVAHQTSAHVLPLFHASKDIHDHDVHRANNSQRDENLISSQKPTAAYQGTIRNERFHSPGSR